MLISKFDFAPLDIVQLTDDPGNDSSRLPTAGNIRREMDAIIDRADVGGQLVFYLAGHGGRQPERVVGSEIDGLDEIFLPMDTKRWDSVGKCVPNALVDDDIGDWFRKLSSKGVNVWAVFDCCHSGDLSRESGTRERYVQPNDQSGLGIPDDTFNFVKESRVNEVTSQRSAIDLPTLENMAILYACQSHEKAIELPIGSDEPEEYHGLLTYSICRSLARARGPLSYRELNHEVYLQFLAAGQTNGPTPLVEGQNIDRVVLGVDVMENSPIEIRIDPEDVLEQRLVLNAGLIRGVSKDCILAVTSPPGKNDSSAKIVGYVRVTAAAGTSAEVQSCDYLGIEGMSADELAGGCCEIVEIRLRESKLAVFVDGDDRHGSPLSDESLEELRRILNDLPKPGSALIEVVSLPDARAWFLKTDGNSVYLAPPRESQEKVLALGETQSFGPFPIGIDLAKQLSTALTQIARAENLLRLASEISVSSRPQQDLPRLRIDKIVKSDGTDRMPENVPSLQLGDVFDLRVTNEGSTEIDLTVLYVNRQKGIQVVYPAQNDVNRIRRGQTRKLPLVRVANGPFGRNHFVFIAVPAKGPNIDFGWLAQKSLPISRGTRSPLHSLLETAIFGEEGTRSDGPASACKFEVVPVDVVNSQVSND